ncbi:MAG: PIG-L family deacetylase, partial [Myxococcota bacterium]
MMPNVKLFCTVLIAALATVTPARSQERPMHSAGALKVELSRLGTTARVLYVAAHPDDENTRLLAYLANQRHLDVAYLSLTRGGGGQNLIGSEQAELLAAIRTQELLAARRVDGARQFFTRARDFGYSKTPKEALAKWGKDKILSDVVWVIRKFRPDVIVTRFTEAGPSHGHHTASAQLARAAFEAAPHPGQFPEHLQHGVTPWAPHRLLLNVPRWRNAKDDVSGYLALDVGGYDARLGVSYGEIAAISRTNHKSQGFGSSGRRGPIMEYFDHLAGPKADGDLLDGVVLDWDRFDGGEQVNAALAAAHQAFDVEQPESMVPHLLAARSALTAVAKKRPVPRVLERISDIDAMIAKALGLYTQAAADRPEVTAGDSIDITLEVTLRRPARLQLDSVAWPDHTDTTARPVALHTPTEVKRKVTVAASEPPSVVHWLREPLQADTYPVTEPARVADPEDGAPLAVALTFTLNGQPWSWSVPITYRRTDPVLGERRQPLLVVPPLTVSPTARIALFAGGRTSPVTLTVRAGRDDAKGSVRLNVPRTWKSEPAAAPVKLAKRGDETTLRFMVTPPSANAKPTQIQPSVTVGKAKYSLRLDVIEYPHLPVQAILRPAQIRLVPLDFEAPSVRVGYIPGPGDTVAEHLRLAGVNVKTIDAGALRSGQFDSFDAIIVGVRAYNTRGSELKSAYPALMRWVEAGGRLVVQYNTSHRWRVLSAPVGPFPFEINRGRVTDETATMTILQPEHALFTQPHKITQRDFEGWVQERGLYFAKTWDERYTPLFTAADPGEPPQKGSAIFAEHGKGAFIYTGLSFFRQL